MASPINFATWMIELLAFGRELLRFRATALCQDGVAGLAVIGFDGKLAISRLMQAIVAPEAARPVFVADVVGIGAPTGLHLGEEVVVVDLLHGLNG